jgi:lactate dehydrogenase-like 2-hydroxyacid dehydrogenase
MNDKPAVLIMQRHLAPLTPFLESAYTVYRFWEGPPLEAGHAVRALVVAGEHPLDKALIEQLPDLGLIACFTAGYDGIDVAWARGRGLQVTHAPGANAEDVADHALGLMLASRRQIASGDRALRAGEWTPETRTITASMRGQRVGIVGLGGIGRALAERCQVMGMKPAWWGPRPKPDAPWPRAASLLDLALESDILAVCARAEEANRAMVDKGVIEALGPSGLLVNVARGQLVDEDALIAALKDGRLGAAALDVFVDEPTPAARWAGVPNTVLTPHTGGATTDSVQRMLAMLMDNLAAFFAGKPVKTPV